MGDKDDVINKDRSCTDALFCLLFTAFWVGMVAIAGLAWTEGNPDILRYGVDSSGYLCGTGKQKAQHDPYDIDNSPSAGINMKDNQFQYYLDIMTVAIPAPGVVAESVCLDKCPDESVFDNSESFVCQYLYRARSDFDIDYLDAEDDYSTNYYTKLTPADKAKSVTNKGPCFAVLVKATDFMNRCVPSDMGSLVAGEELKIDVDGTSTPTGGSSDELKKAIDAFSSSRSYLQEYVGDLLKGWVILVVGGVVGGLVFSLVWMLFLRYFAGCMAWVTILLINVVMIGATLFCATKAGLVGSAEIGVDLPADMPASAVGNDKQTFEYVTYGMAALTVLVLLFTLIMIKRIKIAIACTKVASQAIGAMPMVLFFPLVTFVMVVLLVIWWVAVASFLYAAGDIAWGCETVDLPTGAVETCTYSLEWTKEYQYVGLYHLFGLLWTNQWITGFGYCVIAGAIAQFYWSGGDTKQIGRTPVMSSVKTVFRYHIGSIAFGAFIVACIQLVRIVLEYIDAKTKKAQAGNPILKYVMYCIKYCMWYLEKIMKFINRNAYIMVAVKGTNYCASAVRAVKLILNNALRLAAVNTVGDSMLFIGELCVAGLAGILAFLLTDLPMYTDTESITYLSSPLLPVIASALIAFVVSQLFFGVYEMAIDTVLLCFCEDCQMHNDTPKYAPNLLMDVMGEKK